MKLYTPIPRPLPSEESLRERTARRLCTIPRWLYRHLHKRRQEWDAAEAERIAQEEAILARQEAILRDPGYSDEEKAAARLAIAGRMYRELRKEFGHDPR